MDIRQIWQHKTSGDLYVVVLVDGQLSEAAGPLTQREADAIRNGEYFDNDVEVAADLLESQDNFKIAYEY